MTLSVCVYLWLSSQAAAETPAGGLSHFCVCVCVCRGKVKVIRLVCMDTPGCCWALSVKLRLFWGQRSAQLPVALRWRRGHAALVSRWSPGTLLTRHTRLDSRALIFPSGEPEQCPVLDIKYLLTCDPTGNGLSLCSVTSVVPENR